MVCRGSYIHYTTYNSLYCALMNIIQATVIMQYVFSNTIHLKYKD